MKNKQLAIIIPIIMVLALGLKIAGRTSSSEPDVMKEYVFFANDAKSVDMTTVDRQKAGGESAFLRNKMFNDIVEYKEFPLIQKKGEILGMLPITQGEAVPKSDFSIKPSTTKTFYKLKKSIAPLSWFKEKSKIVCISIFQQSDMGKIRDPRNYKKPRDFGHTENFWYSFPYTISTKKYGTVPYKCFVTRGNPKLNSIFERYMALRRRPLEVQQPTP